MEKENDIIIVENGDIFEGNRLQFADCFFSNSDNFNIIEWCKENKFSLKINNIKIL